MEPFTDHDHSAGIRRTFAWRSAVVFVAAGVLTQLLDRADNSAERLGGLLGGLLTLDGQERPRSQSPVTHGTTVLTSVD